MKRNFVNIEDFSGEEILQLLELAKKLKANRKLHSQALEGKTFALLFTKPSNRTRVSFEVGIHQLGGNCIYLSPREIQLGERESVSDVAGTLSRFVDGIVARTDTHKDVEDLARFSSVPVINGLSDEQHPCQALADLFSIKEKLGKLKGITLAFVGDGNNVCHSLMLGSALVGLQMRIATPKAYAPDPSILKKCQQLGQRSGAEIAWMESPAEAVKDAHVIYADTFVSMGQEAEMKKRLKDFKKFQINSGLAKLADKNFIFMHCLPAHRGQEVTEKIIDGKHSIIFDQAENRLHVQKAILIRLMQ